MFILLESKSEIKKFKNESIYIKNIRTRKTEQNVMRVVFDLKYNFYIDKHFYLKKNEKNIYRLVIDLKLNNKSIVEHKEKVTRKESKFIITIDAGHGGIDPGAINLGHKEKDITLIAAKELKNILEKKNFKIFLTRKDDRFISLRNRRNIAKKSWEKFGAVIIVEKIFDGIELINKLAPEHLEIALDNAKEYLKDIKNAGAIFLGKFTPEAIGDYIAGPNHVLPTDRTARFTSGLNLLDYLKRSSVVYCTEKSIKKIGMDAINLANEEGLQAHALSIECRLKK